MSYDSLVYSVFEMAQLAAQDRVTIAVQTLCHLPNV